MTYLMLGLVLFFGTHFISIVAPGWRSRMIASIGTGPWKVAYSVIAIVGFMLILSGYEQTQLTPAVLYVAPAWLRHVNALLMLPVFPLLLAVYLPGRIKTTLKHPMLLATTLWAFAHLLVNGMLGDVLLFGSFLVWAVADRISFRGRVQTGLITVPPGRFNDAIAVILGLVLYGVFAMYLHRHWFGVTPFPH
jgi:uncharacterized membrane protein